MDAKTARKYIGQFRTYTMPGIDNVTMSGGEKIWLDRMTDQQAIRVANCLMDMEEEAAQGVQKQ